MKTDQERGRWGAFLRRERLSRGLSTEQVRAMLAKRGYRVGESSYAEWESGLKKPSKESEAHFIAMWGEPPPEPMAPSTPMDLSLYLDVVAGLREAVTLQTELLKEVLAVLRGPGRSRAEARLLVALSAIAQADPDEVAGLEELLSREGDAPDMPDKRQAQIPPRSPRE